MNRIAIFIPYFGKDFPNYFSYWLLSAGYNDFIDFYLYTNIEIHEIIPSNIFLIKTEWNEFKEFIQKKFDFNICLEKPYKCCDFKAAYGHIFEDIIDENKYEYWGHCDIDLIFGDLREDIQYAVQNNYEKIGILGHLSLYQYNSKLKYLYRKDIKNLNQEDALNYVDVFQTNVNCYFDEHPGMLLRAYENNLMIYCDFKKKIADIDQKYRYFTIVGGKNNELIFKWENGHLYSIDKHKKIQECLYLHLQKRNIKEIGPIVNDINLFYIFPDKIVQENTLYHFKKKTFWFTLKNRINYYLKEIKAKRRADKVIRKKYLNSKRLLERIIKENITK